MDRDSYSSKVIHAPQYGIRRVECNNCYDFYTYGKGYFNVTAGGYICKNCYEELGDDEK